MKLSVLSKVSEQVSLQMPTHYEHLYFDSLNRDAMVCEIGINIVIQSQSLDYSCV